MQSWMSMTLRLAAVYNLVWGLFCILFPALLFQWAEMEPPRYPELWQCIGMIVGVYGIGYWIAASDPLRHWPIVLVGLLGKIFGPIDFAWALLQGTLPVKFGATILTNDLIWWLPFAAILWQAAGSAMRPPADNQNAADALSSVQGDTGKTLTEMSRVRPVLVVLLRHAGCVFHRQALADLKQVESQLRAMDLEIAIVHMGSGCNQIGQRNGYRLETVVEFSDPQCRIYQALGLERGSFRQLFGPKVWRDALYSLAKGHGIGKLVGDGFQMPGVFLIRDGKATELFRHASAGDRPDYLALAKNANIDGAQPLMGVASRD